jgi:protein-tyrosine phosphatase
MKKVLMVCLGNICRSPLAEGILQSKIDPKKIIVDSAGTGSWHIGNLPDQRSIAVAKTHKIDITNQRCRQFEIADFDRFDLIYVMDRYNYQDVTALSRNEEDRQKVILILSETGSSQKLDVPDPYHGGEGGFEKVFQMLEEACEVIAKKLQS